MQKEYATDIWYDTPSTCSLYHIMALQVLRWRVQVRVQGAPGPIQGFVHVWYSEYGKCLDSLFAVMTSMTVSCHLPLPILVPHLHLHSAKSDRRNPMFILQTTLLLELRTGFVHLGFGIKSSDCDELYSTWYSRLQTPVPGTSFCTPGVDVLYRVSLADCRSCHVNMNAPLIHRVQ